ncbi:MAG: cohesin domain-containing protein [Chlamydiota bacterium]
MRRVVSIVAVLGAAASCGGQIMSFGTGAGAPGEDVSFSLSIDPEEPVTDFGCTFQYDPSLLILQDIYLSKGAEDNYIYRLWYNESPRGTVRISTQSSWGDWADDISQLAILDFTISSSARSTTTPVRFVGVPVWEDDYNGYWYTASSQNGSVTIVAPGPTPTPRPHGKPPEVNLRMESTTIYTWGEEPFVRVQVTANDWAGYPEDAYLAVGIPGGGILYLNARGALVSKATPIVKKMEVENSVSSVGLGDVPSTAPLGLYTVYGTLCSPGKNPTKASNRVSNLDTAQFELVEPPVAPTPVT